MKRTTMMRLAVIVAAILWVAAGVPSADAQSFTTVRPGGRGGTWDFYLPLSYADTATISGQNGSSVKVNENRASLALHQACGFRVVGVRERLGAIDGRWRDVLLLEWRSRTVGT